MKIDDCYTDVRRLSTDKELKDLAVSKDIYRLARKVRIHEVPEHLFDMENETSRARQESLVKSLPHLTVAASHGRTPYIPDEDVKIIDYIDNIKEAEQIDVLYALMSALVKELQPDTEMLDAETFAERINLNDHTTMTSYLSDDIGENSFLVRVLKSCHQTIIARLLHRLRDDELTFKDVRGSWRILIRFSKNPDTGALSHLSTIHRRREQMYLRSDDGFNFTNMYQFEWEVESHYALTDEAVVNNVEMRLLGIHFANDDDLKLYGNHAKHLQAIFKYAHLNQQPPAKSKKEWCTLL